MALARTRKGRQNCVRFAYRGPLVDRLHVLELKHNVEWRSLRAEASRLGNNLNLSRQQSAHAREATACPTIDSARVRGYRTAHAFGLCSESMILLASLVSSFAPAGRSRHLSLRRCSRRASPACSEAPGDEWRAVRARLVQGEQQAGGEAAESFAFESPLIEVGTLLLDTEMQRNLTARPADQAFFHKAVVLLVEHSVGGGARRLKKYTHISNFVNARTSEMSWKVREPSVT